MEKKTQVRAEEGKHDIFITREFDLPVELLFQAHADPELFEQWMSHEYGNTKVTKFKGEKNGDWEFQTSDLQGNVMFRAGGVFHEFIPNQKITRTFEMSNGGFDAQLEFLEFERLTDDTSRLVMQTIFRKVESRDQLLKQPFAMGLSMAHNRLEDVVSKLK